MTKYARKKDGCWIDVYSVPGEFPDHETLTRCLPGESFTQVDDAVKHGDFVSGESDFEERASADAPACETPKSDFAVLLEKVAGLEEKLVTVEAKIDAISPPP